METANKLQHDPWLIQTKDVHPRTGCSAIDELKFSGGRSIPRTYERAKVNDKDDKETQTLRRDPREILCQGCACGLDGTGTVRHFTPGYTFCGFVLSSVDPDRVVIASRGYIVLMIPGATDQDRGKKVFCHGPNEFSMSKRNGAEIGEIRYVSENRASVAYRRGDDSRPLTLNFSRG